LFLQRRQRLLRARQGEFPFPHRLFVGGEARVHLFQLGAAGQQTFGVVGLLGGLGFKLPLPDR
jgi:hypothetical protein